MNDVEATAEALRAAARLLEAAANRIEGLELYVHALVEEKSRYERALCRAGIALGEAGR